MMNRQTELFEDGGLKDEGGMIDKKSGNKVPTGSTREEVRDDIPAKLSEGEFVMPADVVRYHGLDKMMGLRDEAKMGLQKMEAMGQMGNSEEATMSDEMPFGMADLIVVAGDGKEVEMADGGYVTMANGGDPSANVRQLGSVYTPPTSKPLDFTTVMGEGKISYKEYRNADGKNMLVSFIGGIPVYPIPEGYTEYTPGADEPVTPIQEVVEAGPPTLELDDEDRQRAGYETGYSIGYENMTPVQLLRESKRMNSVWGKIAFTIPMLINPLVGAAALGALGDKYPQLDAEIDKQLKLDPNNKSLIAASKLSKDNKKGALIGKTVTTLKNFVGDKITQFFGEDTLKKAIELSGVKTNTPENITTVTKEVTDKKANVPVTVDKVPVSSTTDLTATQEANLKAQQEEETYYDNQGNLQSNKGFDFGDEFDPRGTDQRNIDTNARLNIAPQEDFNRISTPTPLGTTPEIIQATLDDQTRDLIRGSAGNVDTANQQKGLIDRGPTLQGAIPFGQFQGENVTNNFDYAVNKSREIADGPGFVESMRDRNRATVDRKTEERRAERDLNRGDYGYNQIYDGSEVYQQPRTSLLDQVRTGRTDTPDLTDALAAALGYVYDGTVNGYVGKGAIIANDYLRSLPRAVYDLLGMSFNPADAATMDSVTGQALSINDMKTVIENNSVSDQTSSALRGGYDSSQQARERGILPSGSQVAGLGLVTNEQLRQYNQGFMTAGDRYAMTMGGRGLQGTRPEGFGNQNLGFTAQDAPALMADPRDPNFRGSYQGNIPPSNMQGPNFTPLGTTTPFESNMRDRNMRPPAAGPTPYYDAFGNTTIFQGRENQRVDTGIPLSQDPTTGSLAYGARNVQDQLDAATSDYANNTPRPYNDPGAYTSITGMNVSPSNMQGPNFTPDSIDPRGPSQIPDSRRPFPTPQLDSVRGPFAPPVSGTSGRLQDFRGGDPFKPLSGDSPYARDAFPDNVTDISTRASTQLTGPTTSNYGTQNFNAYGEGVTPGLRQGNVTSPGQEEFSELQRRGSGYADVPGYLDSGGPMPQRSAIQTPGYLDSGGPMPQRSARDVPSFGDTDPINVVPANEFQLGAADAARENNLRAQEAEETLYDQQRLPSQLDATRIMGINDPLSRSDPRGRNQIPDSRRPFIGAGTDPYAGINEVNLEPEGPRRDATITDSLLDSGMGAALASGRSPVSLPVSLDAPSMDMSFDPTRQESKKPFQSSTKVVPELKKRKTSGTTVNMFGDKVTKGQKGSDEYLFDRTEVAAKEKEYKDKQQELKSLTRGSKYLLRSGKQAEQNDPIAMYNREVESTGYIGTDAEGYGVGMIAGPGQAGVVVDESGKALKNDDRKTIYQDSAGVQYTKSTFGKKETLDGGKYTPAKDVKKGDGNDGDNDGEADSGKIICTAMNASYGFGSYRQAIWLNYSNKHLTKAHEVGYHTLFLPLVYLAYTKDIKFIRTLLEHGTRRRTADLRAELKGTKRNTLGRFYRSIFEPLCYTVGKIKIALGN